MIKTLTTLSIFLLGLLAQAQTTETKTGSRFSKIEVSGNIELIYTESAAESIKVEASLAQNTSNVQTQIKDGILKINSKDMSNETYKVYVTGNALSNLKASGAKVRIVNQLSASELSVTLTADATFAGNLKPTKKMTLQMESNSSFTGRIETQALYASISDDAKICLTGKAISASLNANDRTVCLAGNFVAPTIKINAHDFAILKIHASHAIDLNVSEKARIKYTGNPTWVSMNENAIAVNSLQNTIEAVAAN